MERRKDNKTREAVEEALQRKDIELLHNDVKAILTQTKITNGRVGKLENWRSWMTGGMTILSILVIPIILYIITKGI